MPKTTAALSSYNYSLSGGTFTFIFTLTAPPPAAFPVNLAYTPNNPGLPALVTIPKGSANYQVSLVAPVGGGGTYTVTASARRVTRTLTIYLP